MKEFFKVLPEIQTKHSMRVAESNSKGYGNSLMAEIPYLCESD